MVPNEWTAMVTALRQAQVARECMRNHVATSQMRDDAALAFGRALDAIYAALDVMLERGDLGRIAVFLDQKGRG